MKPIKEYRDLVQAHSKHMLSTIDVVSDLGDLDISEVTLLLLKEYLAKQSARLKRSSLEH